MIGNINWQEYLRRHIQLLVNLILIFGVLTPLSAIFQLYGDRL